MEMRPMGRRRLLAAAAAASLSWLVFCCAGAAAAETSVVPVGVVPDLSSDVGRSRLSGISMALDDFYVKNPSYATRVELHVMDSRGDPGATTAHAESKRINARKLMEGNSSKMCGYSNKTLRIGVPLKDGFKAFVDVSYPSFCNNNYTRARSTEKQIITGYSIEMFATAMRKLQPPPPRYEFCVFNGTYDELVDIVSSGILDGAAGDVTIISNRTRGTDFTMPYTQSGVSLLVRRDRLELIQWTFLTPLSKGLWFATVGFFFFTGFVVWVIERPRNPEYQGACLRQLSTASYFAFSTLTFSHDHIIRSPLSKFVVVIWCFVVLVVVQSYTASLSSLLTANRLQPSVKDLNQLWSDGDYVGYQRGSFVLSFLRDYRNFSEEKLIPYSTKHQYAEALRKGSKKKGVSAIVDEVPYLTVFLSDKKYQEEFQITDHIYTTPGFGFVFNPVYSPLVHDLSTAILNVNEGDEGPEIEEKWLGTADASQTTITTTAYTPLTLGNFSGLFLISGAISSLMLLISIVRLTHARWTKARDANAQSVDDTTPGKKESRPLQDAMEQPQPEARNEDYQGAHGTAEGAHRGSSGSSGHEEHRAMHNGYVPAQSFEMIEMNTVMLDQYCTVPLGLQR